jgi:hypothetical protein
MLLLNSFLAYGCEPIAFTTVIMVYIGVST